MEGEKCGVSDPVPVGYTIYVITQDEYDICRGEAEDEC